MPAATTAKPKKSIPLTEKQLKSIEDRIAKSETKTDAAIALGVSREVLERIRTYKSCSEKTYKRLFPNDPIPDAG